MRHDELIDDLGRRMAGEDFARLVEIGGLLQGHAQAMQELEAELELLVVSYGLVGDIADGRNPNQPTTNVWWRKTPADWRCPCCRRSKAEILRPDRNGRPIGHLTAHHDHFREFLDNVEAERAKVVGAPAALDTSAKRFLHRFAEGLIRFDEIVICQDCNTADAEAKKIAGAPAHLTFTPAEIASFIIPAFNRVHGIDRDRLKTTYAKAFDHYEVRKAATERLADRVLNGSHWHEHVEWPDRPDPIDGAIETRMRILGFREGAHALTIERLLAPPTAKAADHTRWRSKRRQTAEAPTDDEVKFVISRLSDMWTRVADGWRCPGCDRTKKQTIRPTKQFAWMFVLDEARLSDPDAPYGEATVLICDACRQVIKDFNQEARADADIGARSLPYLRLSDLRRLVQPQAHGLHNIDDGAAREILASLKVQGSQ